MKIVQITAATEYRRIPNGELEAYEDATVYGLGDDNKLYYWGVTKSTRVEHKEPDEEGDMYHYEREYGWIESGK